MCLITSWQDTDSLSLSLRFGVTMVTKRLPLSSSLCIKIKLDKRLFPFDKIKFLGRATRHGKASAQVRHRLGLQCSEAILQKSFLYLGILK